MKGKGGRVKLLVGYGRDLGMAFQIRDDLNYAEKQATPPVESTGILPVDSTA